MPRQFTQGQELRAAFFPRTDVMEANEVDLFTRAVLGDLEEVHHTEEARLARQLRGNVRITDRGDGIDFDFAFLHAVPVAHLYVRTLPNPDAASDLSAADSLAQSLGEYHGVDF